MERIPCAECKSILSKRPWNTLLLWLYLLPTMIHEEDDLTLLTIMIDQGEYYASLNTPRLSIPDYINHDPINLNTISEEVSYSNTGYSRAEIYRLFLAMG